MATTSESTQSVPLSGLGRFCRVGGWIIEPPQDIQPTLQDSQDADVVIVGGGFAGLSTALELRQRGLDVVVLEREFAGFGASGRNAGYLAGSMGVEFELFHKRVGRDQACEIVRFYDEGVSYVERRLKELSIDCDYLPSGLIRAAVHPVQERKLRQAMELGAELGSKTRFVDSVEMRERGIPASFLFGCTQHGGTLDPGKYVLGLRRAALKAGVRLFENTAVKSWAEGKQVCVKSDQGQVSAPWMVLATNAYTPEIGMLRNKIAPMRVSAIETEPLTDEQLDRLGWRGREGIVTPHWTMESHRLTARNSLVITTKRISYVFGGRTANVPDMQAYQALRLALKERFPMLAEHPIRHCWSGYISLAYDALPVVGLTGAHQNILHTAGCAGHGVGTQSLMGLLLAERICDVEHPLFKALQHKTPSTLPEPLQWGLLRSALAGANTMDAWVNRKARSLAITQ